MTNCFEMKCPKCGNEDRIDIHAAVWLRLTADGTDADASNCGDHEYTPESPACCAACDYTGSVKDFDPPDEDSEDQCLKLVITEQNDTRIILGIDHAGRQWEIDVRLDLDEDGGIVADIARDGIHCTGAEFGWYDKHDNEPQE